MSDGFDVLVIGGGPGGYACAIRAAQLGMATAVIEKQKLGGVCVNVGCIPTKALLQSAHVAELIRRDAKSLGIAVADVKLDVAAAVKRSRRVSDQSSKGVALLLEKNGVSVLTGEGTLLGSGRIQVGDEVYSANKAIVLATGSRVKGIPQIGLDIDRNNVITSDEALFMEEVPATLAIVGAGAVGMEFADIFNAFGSRVTIIEMLPQILPLEDADCAEAVAKSYKRRKIEMLAGAQITGAQVEQDKVTLLVSTEGDSCELEVDKVLLAAGRALNLEGIGLEAAGVAIADTGFVKVDENLQTTAEGVYCIGDIAGPPMLAHKAEEEGVAVAEILAGQEGHVNYDVIPSVVYTSPEVASVGKTEDELKQAGVHYKVGKFPFSANGRAKVNRTTDGFVKVLSDQATDQVLGVHIIGPDAGTMIAEAAVLMEFGGSAEDLARTCHAHPTLNEAVKEAALAVENRPIHM